MNSLRIKKIIAFSFIMIPLMVWLPMQRKDRAIRSSVNAYGGKIEPKILSTLEQINRDFCQIEGIVSARSRSIQFVGKDDRIKRYRYAYNGLWCNDDLLIRGVKSFNIEYRDSYGNLLTRASDYIEDVGSIVCTLSMVSKDSEIYTIFRVNVIPNRIINTKDIVRLIDSP